MRRVGEVVEKTYMACGCGGVEVVREEVERAACACRLGKIVRQPKYTRSRREERNVAYLVEPKHRLWLRAGSKAKRR